MTDTASDPFTRAGPVYLAARRQCARSGDPLEVAPAPVNWWRIARGAIGLALFLGLIWGAAVWGAGQAAVFP